MALSQRLVRLGMILGLGALVQAQTYTLQDAYNETNFFQQFDFFSGADPTEGTVSYVTGPTADTSGLAGYANGGVFLGVDSKTTNPTNGRASVRVTSQKSYTHGLFIADIAHQPGGICGVWPALWTLATGDSWPTNGEIDIIEGVNSANYNTQTLHTNEGCVATVQGDCTGNLGCPATENNTQSYGAGFNAIGGGVHAMEWTSQGISTWFFPRTAIPQDISAGNPNPSGWGVPANKFSGSGCNFDAHFQNHQIVVNTDFCGQWAGKPDVWGSDPVCSSKATTCSDYVNQNPSAFKEAYWLIYSIKVYSQSGNSKRDSRVPKPFMS